MKAGVSYSTAMAMSQPATIGDHVLIDACEECGTQFKVEDSPRPNHCSHDCFYQDKGEGALNQLKADHTVCASCFRYVKETYCPNDEYLDDASDLSAIDGVTYTGGPDGKPVLDVTGVEKTTRPAGIRSDSRLDEFCYIGEQFETEHTRYLYRGGPWVCECGNVDLSEHNELLANQDEEGMVLALLDRLREFYEKGAIQQSPDREVFFEYFEERDTGLQVAVGACLYK